MRIVFVNLHTDWMLVKTSSVYVYKFSAALKHKYLLDYLLRQDDIEVCSYLNDRAFSLFDRGPDLLQKFLNVFSPLENNIILKKNNINPKCIKIIRRPEEIHSDDIVVLYNIMSNNYRHIKDVNAFKALSFLHFHGRECESEIILNAGVNVLFNETNLQKSSEIFRRFYHLPLPWITHPFVFAERFKPKKPFAERKVKAFSVGTITYKTHREFIEVYGDACDQPVRKFVKDNQDYFNETVDCYSEDYIESGDAKKIKSSDMCLVRLYKRVYNRFSIGQQKKYFSFDMVEKFNEYKMHIVGEEILGVPGIGYVEGMACGSAYIGLDSPMYRDLGLVPGIHYITYDGTKEGLRATIEYWQRPENQPRLEAIANTGCNFVRENFCGEKVAERLIASLIKSQKEWVEQKH